MTARGTCRRRRHAGAPARARRMSRSVRTARRSTCSAVRSCCSAAAGDDWAPPGVEAHVIDADGFLEAYGITREGAALIRPDGIVGWRSTGAFAHDELTAALYSILALDVTPPVA